VLAAPLAAQAPQLRVHDAQVGFTSITISQPVDYSLKVGHTLTYELTAQPGRIGLLAFGAPAAPPGFLLGGAVVSIDPATALMAIPGQLVPASGALAFSAQVPNLPEGTTIHAQGATLDLATLQIKLSSGLHGKVTHKPFVHVISASKSGHAQANLFGSSQLLIQTQAEWIAFMNQHNAFMDVPALDFSAYALLVAFHGKALTTGYSVRIDEITPTATTLDVKATHTWPGTCGAFFAETAPLHIVALPQALLAPIGVYTPTLFTPCP